MLSQGQKRRVVLARLWLQHLPLWILDEPFTALDAAATDLLKQKIESFANAGGMVVMTSHQDFSLNVPHFVNLKLCS
jgi:heme exporter protein A